MDVKECIVPVLLNAGELLLARFQERTMDKSQTYSDLNLLELISPAVNHWLLLKTYLERVA